MNRSVRITTGLTRTAQAVLLGAALLVALVLALGVTTALAAVPGDPLRLGQLNSINALTNLVGNRAGAMLQVKNNTGPAINLNVPAGQAPAVISAGAGKVANLDADKLDGKDAAAFYPSKTYIRDVPGQGRANAFDEVFATCDPGDLIVSGGYDGVDAASTIVAVNLPFKNGWEVIWFSSGTADDLTVRAICADVA